MHPCGFLSFPSCIMFNLSFFLSLRVCLLYTTPAATGHIYEVAAAGGFCLTRYRCISYGFSIYGFDAPLLILQAEATRALCHLNFIHL